MYKENLFNLIRQEEVVIWAGAGISLYAGYPSGNRMGEILLENLSNAERKYINENLLLPDLAEEFYRIKGNNKNSLIRILNKTFIDFKPISTSCHDKIVSIPHFKTIITTNYDKLFEDTYGGEGQLIYSPVQIPYIDKNKTSIFKIHGDLTEPNSIIITKSDYIRFFAENTEYNVLWTLIKERISTNCILFMGYNLEDHNISAIFDRITNVLKDNQKECFFIAPNIPKTKENHLISKGIHYINMTAEDFIDELIENIKENLFSDLQDKKVSADTVRKCLLKHNLLPELKSTQDSFKITSLTSLGGDIEGLINLKIKNNKEVIEKLDKYRLGEEIGEYTIPESELLGVDLSFGGFKYPKSEGDPFITIKSVPCLTSKFDISFENGKEYTNIPFEQYRISSTGLFEFHIKLSSGIVKVRINQVKSDDIRANVNFTFTYTHNTLCENVNDEIEFFSFMKNLSSAEPFSIYFESRLLFSNSLSLLHDLLDNASLFLSYFENLKKVENHYKLRFANFEFSSITERTLKQLEKIVSVIDNNEFITKWDGDIQVRLHSNTKEVIDMLYKMNDVNPSFVAIKGEPEIIELHGRKITLGYLRYEITNAYITNMMEIENEGGIAKISSKHKILKTSYVLDNKEGNPNEYLQ